MQLLASPLFSRLRPSMKMNFGRFSPNGKRSADSWALLFTSSNLSVWNA